MPNVSLPSVSHGKSRMDELSEQAKHIGRLLQDRVADYMFTYFPTKTYKLDVFPSFAGRTSWKEPLAATLSIEGVTEEGYEPYGLCDARSGAFLSEQAHFMLGQIVQELEALLTQKGR